MNATTKSGKNEIIKYTIRFKNDGTNEVVASDPISMPDFCYVQNGVDFEEAADFDGPLGMTGVVQFAQLFDTIEECEQSIKTIKSIYPDGNGKGEYDWHVVGVRWTKHGALKPVKRSKINPA